MLSATLSGAAVAISLASFVISYFTYRGTGPRVAAVRHTLIIYPKEVYLQVKVINSGLGEVDIEGANCISLARP